MVTRRSLHCALAAVVVLALCSVAVLQVGAVSSPVVDTDEVEAAVGGDAYATEQDGQRYAWVGTDDPLELTVEGYQLSGNESWNDARDASGNESGVDVELCLATATQDSSWTTHSCVVSEVSNASAGSTPPLDATLALDDRFEPGEVQVRLSLAQLECEGDCGDDADCTDGADCASEALGSTELGLHLLDPDGDLDGDGLANEAEVAAGTELAAADTDGDGLEDGPEVDEHGTDPTDEDTDDDGLADAEEVRRWDSEPTTADTDGDGLDDGAEIESYGSDPTDPHSDDDGLDDGTEVHQHDTNPTKTDTDGDGIGDRIEVDRDTDPTDPNDPDDGSAGTESSTTDPAAGPAPGEEAASAGDEAFQRGFLTNDGDDAGPSFVSETDLTVLGFLFSLLGVVVPLLREG